MSLNFWWRIHSTNLYRYIYRKHEGILTEVLIFAAKTHSYIYSVTDWWNQLCKIWKKNESTLHALSYGWSDEEWPMTVKCMLPLSRWWQTHKTLTSVQALRDRGVPMEMPLSPLNNALIVEIASLLLPHPEWSVTMALSQCHGNLLCICGNGICYHGNLCFFSHYQSSILACVVKSVEHYMENYWYNICLVCLFIDL